MTGKKRRKIGGDENLQESYWMGDCLSQGIVPPLSESYPKQYSFYEESSLSFNPPHILSSSNFSESANKKFEYIPDYDH